MFESNCSQKSEGSNPINQDHQNVFFPVEGLSKTEDLRKHAKTVALEYNSAQASSQGVHNASKSSFPTRTKVRVATEAATEAAGVLLLILMVLLLLLYCFFYFFYCFITELQGLEQRQKHQCCGQE